MHMCNKMCWKILEAYALNPVISIKGGQMSYLGGTESGVIRLPKAV